ncbi:hypothetical protein JKP88DRAFT_244276 [Tribonema minus]|uniref:Uncharacterized protein n=1 Tax=Tribonema minus TaxID=303371 RepID=A0A836CH20_9STRA|nr:hypothetical protein JKP88DRAFT_244276 [Tribonema minus]
MCRSSMMHDAVRRQKVEVVQQTRLLRHDVVVVRRRITHVLLLPLELELAAAAPRRGCGTGTRSPPATLRLRMAQSPIESAIGMETLAKRWGYLAKTARDVIRDIRGNEPMKLWWQQYEAALAEFGPRARELVEAGAAANWGIEDTDPYFDKDANSRNSPQAVMAARVMRRILAGAFAAQRCQPDDPPGLHRSVQYVLAAADSITDRLPPETIKDNAAARPDTLRKLWAALTAGFFQKAKIQVVNVIAGERELNSVAHALLYLSLDARCGSLQCASELFYRRKKGRETGAVATSSCQRHALKELLRHVRQQPAWQR